MCAMTTYGTENINVFVCEKQGATAELTLRKMSNNSRKTHTDPSEKDVNATLC